MSIQRFASSVFLLVGFGRCDVRLDARAAGGPCRQSQPLRGDALAQHRAASRRADEGGGRRAEPALHLLHRHGERRRVEDDRRRAARGSRSSTTSRPDRSARSPSRRPIPTSSTSAAAKGCSGPTWRSATASTSPPTPARRGRISACATRSRSRSIAVDPKNPNRLFVAALGHPYGPNEERGIFRSTDGGQTFQNGALQGREHRRQGRRHRSVQSRHRLRDAVGGAAGAVGKRRVERHQRRHLQVDRRRHDVEAADEGPADRASSTPSSRSRRAIRDGSTRRVEAAWRRGERRAGDLPDRRRRAARRGRAVTDRQRVRQPRSTKRAASCIRRIPTR